jgi:hypothetical protein
MSTRPLHRSYLLVLISALLLAAGASSCGSSRIRFESEPEGATVLGVRPGNAPVKLGTTPVEVSTANHPEIFSGNAQVTIQKEGHESASFLIPRPALSSEARISVSLKGSSLPLACTQAETAMREVAEGVAYSQRLLLKKDYGEAKRSLENLVSRFNKVSVLYDLLGNAHYLSKDLDAALTAYERSLELYPGNKETQRMIDKLKSIRGQGQR